MLPPLYVELGVAEVKNELLPNTRVFTEATLCELSQDGHKTDVLVETEPPGLLS